MTTAEHLLSSRLSECVSDILLLPQNLVKGKFLNFVLINREKLLEKVKYSLSRNYDGMTKLMTIVKGRQENNEKK